MSIRIIAPSEARSRREHARWLRRMRRLAARWTERGAAPQEPGRPVGKPTTVSAEVWAEWDVRNPLAIWDILGIDPGKVDGWAHLREELTARLATVEAGHPQGDPRPPAPTGLEARVSEAVSQVRGPTVKARPQGGAEPDFTVEGLYEEVVTELERGGFCAARDHIDKLFRAAVNGLASEGAAPPPRPEPNWRTRGLEGSATGVVATGVRGDPAVQRCVREAIGGVLCSARHSDGDAVVVSMEALEALAHSILVDFEWDGGENPCLIPLPLHVDDDGRELTEDEILADRGSLEAALAEWSLVPGRAGELLRDQADQARLSRRLVGLVDDLPLPVPLADLRPWAPSRRALDSFFAALGFARWESAVDAHRPGRR